MKKHLLTALVAAAAVTATAAVDPEAVLMNVDGHDITVSEFEYLFNKNNTQQQTPQSLDEYLQMFIDYKLKVAEAEHEGLQDSPDFIKEFTGFRSDLATPYLRVQEIEDSLVDESYGHRLRDVYVSHIMLPLEVQYKAQADSLLREILAGNITFEDAAARYSLDRRSSVRNGRMGWVVPGRFPWPFEKASYDTEVGQLSPVVNSGLGWHIIRPERSEPALGEVEASHILLMTRGLPDSLQAVAKERIDSIYTVLQAGEDFAELAKRFSQDPGSARNGGSLGWFNHGQMVEEFDSVAYALADGQISTPFPTAFGWHIIKRTGHRGAPELTEELRKAIISQMKNDERGTAATDAYIQRAMASQHAAVDNDAISRIRDLIAANDGGYDSTMVAQLMTMNDIVATFDHGSVPLYKAMERVPYTSATDAANAAKLISGAAMSALQGAVLDYERENLANTNPNYRNLVNEYRDGILLYEVSNRNVWEKATKDTEGLAKYFAANRDKYKWDEPRFKSYIFFASSDSVLNSAMAYADSICPDGTMPFTPAEFTQTMRQKFGKDLKIERVIAARGENPITDYLAYDGSKPDADKKSRWDAYGAWRGRMISIPEEPSDVRGAAVTDYQTALGEQWVNQLRKKYKVKVNNKVFKQLKAQQAR